MMVSCMESVMTEGTGAGLKLQGISCAGKTGTTNDKKDGWFVGFTPYYTTGVWVGCDNPTPIQDLTGSSYPGVIWKDYMTWANDGLEDIGFKDYKGASSNKGDTTQSEEEEPEEEEEEEIKEEETEVKPSDDVDDDKKPPVTQAPKPSKPVPSKKPNNNNDSNGESEDFGGDNTPDQDPGWDEDENNQPGDVPEEDPPEEDVPEDGGDGEVVEAE